MNRAENLVYFVKNKFSKKTSQKHFQGKKVLNILDLSEGQSFLKLMNF